MEAPIYTEFYIRCEENEPGAFPVKTQNEDGEFEFHLRKGNFDDIHQNTMIYIEIEHEIKYPYASIDFWRDLDWPTPTTIYYCQAAVVFSPKASLI